MVTTAETVFQPAVQARDQEWRQRALSEAKREVGANCEELKLREDKEYNKVDATSVDA